MLKNKVRVQVSVDKEVKPHLVKYKDEGGNVSGLFNYLLRKHFNLIDNKQAS